MRRLTECVLLDSPGLVFSYSGGKVIDVFDGHVCLVDEARPTIDEIGRRIKLKYPPQFTARCIVDAD